MANKNVFSRGKMLAQWHHLPSQPPYFWKVVLQLPLFCLSGIHSTEAHLNQKPPTGSSTSGDPMILSDLPDATKLTQLTLFWHTVFSFIFLYSYAIKIFRNRLCNGCLWSSASILSIPLLPEPRIVPGTCQVLN